MPCIKMIITPIYASKSSQNPLEPNLMLKRSLSTARYRPLKARGRNSSIPITVLGVQMPDPVCVRLCVRVRARAHVCNVTHGCGLR